jgi:pimeloyl-ACP methyl ester carboxylesterase
MRTVLSLALTALLALPALGGAQARPKPLRTGYVPANGVNYYYEIHGRGQPLLLLHGGLGSIDMFEPGLPEFAKHRLVIAVDLHGHGRTALGGGDRPINLPAMGDDMATVVKQLGYDSVDVLGYSMGGGVALRMAIQHPGAVRRLVLVSTPFAQDGFFAEMLPQQAAVGAAMADAMKETPMFKSYVTIAPRPQDFPRLLDQMGAWMRTPYDWSEDVKTLKGPVLLLYGDHDMIRPEHIVRFYQLLGEGLKDAGWQREHMGQNRLAILPNLTHYEMFLSPALVPTVLPFLNGQTGAPVWRGAPQK